MLLIKNNVYWLWSSRLPEPYLCMGTDLNLMICVVGGMVYLYRYVLWHFAMVDQIRGQSFEALGAGAGYDLKTVQ